MVAMEEILILSMEINNIYIYIYEMFMRSRVPKMKIINLNVVVLMFIDIFIHFPPKNKLVFYFQLLPTHVVLLFTSSMFLY